MHVRAVLKVASLLALCAAGVKSQDTSGEDDSVGCTIVITVTNTEGLSYCDDSSELDDTDDSDSSEDSSRNSATSNINRTQGSILAGVLAAGFLVAASIV
ncbi:hypothetical protein LPJ81_003987 [Coemansia sp. IMI 209127]|nr:hypothetical protein LPJ81_003987 [Coemansia sp. IMI 209127]